MNLKEKNITLFLTQKMSKNEVEDIPIITPSVNRGYNSTKKCYLGDRFLVDPTILELSIKLKHRYEP